MKLIVCKEPVISIELNNDEVAQFSSCYYPLDENTVDIFIGSMSKENQNKLQMLVQSEAPDVISIRDIFASELTHAVSLIQLCK